MASEISAVIANVADRQPLAARTANTTSTQGIAGASDVRASQNASAQVATSEVDREAVSQAVQELNDHVQNIRRDLEFSVDETSGRTVISVIDPESEEVIRQIPPESVIDAARNLQRLEGLLLSAEA